LPILLSHCITNISEDKVKLAARLLREAGRFDLPADGGVPGRKRTTQESLVRLGGPEKKERLGPWEASRTSARVGAPMHMRPIKDAFSAPRDGRSSVTSDVTMLERRPDEEEWRRGQSTAPRQQKVEDHVVCNDVSSHLDAQVGHHGKGESMKFSKLSWFMGRRV
ncbi:hypothetical protein NDU88_006194, partial [Pleurodeles waltl]